MKFFLSLAILMAFGVISFRIKWLSLTGSLVASLFGWSLLYLGGGAWTLSVLVFFGTSSVLSKIGRVTNSVPDNNTEDIRNGGQVLANGGVAWILLLVNAANPDPFWLMGFFGAIAAATADTWGTETGRLSQGKTRSIISGKIVPQGVSGGISWQGTLGGLTGACLIAGIAVIFSPESADFTIIHFYSILVITCAGAIGSFVDSILGATLEVQYQASKQIAGWRWMTNNVVNFICTASGALSAMIFYCMIIVNFSSYSPVL